MSIFSWSNRNANNVLILVEETGVFFQWKQDFNEKYAEYDYRGSGKTRKKVRITAVVPGIVVRLGKTSNYVI